MPSRPHGDALLNQKRPDLIDRSSTARHQPRANSVHCLQVQWILVFLGNDPQVWSHCRFCDSLRIVAIVPLPLVERLNIDCRNDPGLEAELPQHTANKMRALAGLHANNATGQAFKDRM